YSDTTLLIFLYRYPDHQDLHSFPTRRSSDLSPEAGSYGLRQGITDLVCWTICESSGTPKRHPHKSLTQPLRFSRARLTVSTVCSDRKSTRLNSSHLGISYAVFCLKKKNIQNNTNSTPACRKCSTALPCPTTSTIARLPITSGTPRLTAPNSRPKLGLLTARDHRSL